MEVNRELLAGLSIADLEVIKQKAFKGLISPQNRKECTYWQDITNEVTAEINQRIRNIFKP